MYQSKIIFTKNANQLVKLVKIMINATPVMIIKIEQSIRYSINVIVKLDIFKN